MPDFEKWFANYKKQRMRKDRMAGALILIGGGRSMNYMNSRIQNLKI